MQLTNSVQNDNSMSIPNNFWFDLPSDLMRFNICNEISFIALRQLASTCKAWRDLICHNETGCFYIKPLGLTCEKPNSWMELYRPYLDVHIVAVDVSGSMNNKLSRGYSRSKIAIYQARQLAAEIIHKAEFKEIYCLAFDNECVVKIIEPSKLYSLEPKAVNGDEPQPVDGDLSIEGGESQALAGSSTLSVKNPGKRDMTNLPICDDVIASTMIEEQSGADGSSPLTDFLSQRMNEPTLTFKALSLNEKVARVQMKVTKFFKSQRGERDTDFNKLALAVNNIYEDNRDKIDFYVTVISDFDIREGNLLRKFQCPVALQCLRVDDCERGDKVEKKMFAEWEVVQEGIVEDGSDDFDESTEEFDFEMFEWFDTIGATSESLRGLKRKREEEEPEKKDLDEEEQKQRLLFPVDLSFQTIDPENIGLLPRDERPSKKRRR
jgi:hypothetical protein